MYIITVYFDDIDRPLIGHVVVNESELDAARMQIEAHLGPSYTMTILKADSLDDMVLQLDELNRDEEPGS